MGVDPVRIELEVQVVDESLIGLARSTDGTTREFAGWLGLLNVLEGLIPDASQSDDRDSHDLADR